MEEKILYEGITFDDVLLLPGYSEIAPADTDLSTRLTSRIRLNIPLLSAPMDTVTEADLAIGLAQAGGIGVIHKNLSVDEQVAEVVKVKRSANGVIVDPVTLPPDAPVGEAARLMEAHRISGLPVTEGGARNGRVRGIVTHRDMKFLPNRDLPIDQVMTSDRLVTAGPDTTLEQAEQILYRNKVEKLILVDGEGRLTGLITMRDIDKLQQFPLACRDDRGRLRVAAAVGIHDLERVDELLQAGVDAIVVDSAHGHSRGVIETVRAARARYDIDLIAGNVATERGARDLIEAGASAVKAGIGPGSICTTRVVTGVGVPQITAIFNAARATVPAGVPLIADGGIRHSGEIAKALVAGASAVMLGSLFAGLDESPGETVIQGGRRYKAYRGMGSAGAMMAGSADRYGQSEAPKRKYVPEGVEGRVPYRGPLGDFVYQMVGGIRAAMGYCGTPDIDGLRKDACFCRTSPAGVAESHPHDITITREASNYSVE